MNGDQMGLVEQAVSAYAALLGDDSGDPSNRAQLLDQARAVASTIVREYGLGDVTPDPDPSAQIGVERARAAIHPARSLRAGALMFEALFPVLSEPLPGNTVEIGIALHREIQGRLVAGSIPYVDYLLTTLLSSQHEERGKIARDVHDRIAHGMGAALQQLELFDHYRSRDSERAETHLSAARTSVVDSVDSARRLSADLWVKMPGDSLADALAAYLETSAPDGVDTSVSARGPEPDIRPEVSEELYLLLREALRNAIIHAQPSSINARLTVQDDVFRAVVIDNGRGFDVAAVTADKTVGGLVSIRERAEVLGGKASISSILGAGTTVEVLYPIAGPTR